MERQAHRAGAAEPNRFRHLFELVCACGNHPARLGDTEGDDFPVYATAHRFREDMEQPAGRQGRCPGTGTWTCAKPY